jgi:hypothetical protein
MSSERDSLIKELAEVPRLVAELPQWQQGLLDEASKATCNTPRKPTGDTMSYRDRLAKAAQTLKVVQSEVDAILAERRFDVADLDNRTIAAHFVDMETLVIVDTDGMYTNVEVMADIDYDSFLDSLSPMRPEVAHKLHILSDALYARYLAAVDEYEQADRVPAFEART